MNGQNMMRSPSESCSGTAMRAAQIPVRIFLSLSPEQILPQPDRTPGGKEV